MALAMLIFVVETNVISFTMHKLLRFAEKMYNFRNEKVPHTFSVNDSVWCRKKKVQHVTHKKVNIS